MTNAYDHVRYPSKVATKTHPADLSAFAALFGKPYAPFEAARVLEIGCGDGVNLINLALCAPNSEFIGVDLAEMPINQARETFEELGLSNVRFHRQDLTQIEDTLGRFDYIIAHGVYAWVSPEARQALMRVVGASLEVHGLALISYNAYPGAAFRQILRELMLDASHEIENPAERLRVARSVLTHTIDSWSDSDPHHAVLKATARYLLDKPHEVLFHDELGAHFEPQFLRDVIATAGKVGLDYLCDAQSPLSAEALFPSAKFAAAEPFSAGDWNRFEQLSDFSDVRFFRDSIFCRRGGIDRRVEPARLRGLWAFGDPRPINESQGSQSSAFAVGQEGTLTTNDPKLSQLLSRMAAAHPSCVSLDEAADDPNLASHILRLFVANAIRLRTAPYTFTLAPGNRPLASPLARLQARRGEQYLASLRHISVSVDPIGRELLELLDGTRTRDDFARDAAARAGILDAGEAAAKASTAITVMARLGLLEA
jgi:SAM-dependent methyltransferase